MYEVDILEKLQWIPYATEDSLKKIDKVVYKLTKERPNQYMRVLSSNTVMCFLDGSDYQYWWFKNYIVRERAEEFDIVGSFYAHQKKLEMTKQRKENNNE